MLPLRCLACSLCPLSPAICFRSTNGLFGHARPFPRGAQNAFGVQSQPVTADVAVRWPESSSASQQDAFVAATTSAGAAATVTGRPDAAMSLAGGTGLVRVCAARPPPPCDLQEACMLPASGCVQHAG